MESTTFSIPTFRKAAIETRLNKLTRKATRYGNTDIGFQFGETYVTEMTTSEGDKINVEMIDVIVSGEAPKIDGWQLLARVELMGSENLIHQVPVSGLTADEQFRHHNGYCDHCNTARYRKDVYVLSDGEKQIAVGRNCLRDFLGIDDPKAIVNRAQFFEMVNKEFEQDEEFSVSGSGFFRLNEMLTVAAAYIRQEGYISKAKQLETGLSTTGESAKYALSGYPEYQIETNDQDSQWAEKTIQFFRSTDSFNNTYLDNIRVLIKQDIVDPRHVNLIASSVITVQRELAKKENASKNTSEFVGVVKQRLKGLKLTLTKVIFLGHGPFGSSFLHLMEDAKGNVFSWITTNKMQVAEGTEVCLDATIKQHKEYNGINQTVLTRARVK